MQHKNMLWLQNMPNADESKQARMQRNLASQRINTPRELSNNVFTINIIITFTIVNGSFISFMMVLVFVGTFFSNPSWSYVKPSLSVEAFLYYYFSFSLLALSYRKAASQYWHLQQLTKQREVILSCSKLRVNNIGLIQLGIQQVTSKYSMNTSELRNQIILMRKLNLNAHYCSCSILAG